MIRKRLNSLRCMTEIHNHQNFFILRQVQSGGKRIRIKEIHLTAVHALIGSRQQHVCRHNSRVLYICSSERSEPQIRNG